ncbi:GYDIA family GHMP kinase [Flavobacterium agrisoli]|uniref:GHMP kinase n=1 Tax=Flavobacterium agrisoli TaxID=2793066 RepID=A0A934UKL5_9FLAO|nr:GYDIA family GHMP kinase [Flavobacterium agrisoli]MBK0370683.1 GHMP kinase [Flavobacterium agrisoli]
MQQTFYSNGKLLITGEYLVLDGAMALGLPTKKGQNLVVNPNNTNHISWKSFDADGNVWFETTFETKDIALQDNNSAEGIKSTLLTILYEAKQLNPNFLQPNQGFDIETHLTFPRNWGLGTSSTLINNIAQWAHVDAFKLLQNSFGGSGYDIACAQHNTAILYQITDHKPRVKAIEYKPSFSENLYFVYLNQKQNSKAAISAYHKNKKSNLNKVITKINGLTQQVLEAPNAKALAEILFKHEKTLSNLLEVETVKTQYFSDFEGEIKSLGAWGGDFVLVVATSNPTAYFQNKGFETILTYEQMIL